MIDALLQGQLFGKPVERTARNGARYVTCKLRTVTRDGEALCTDVITLQKAACTALLALDDGDAVAVSGELTPKVWTDREGTPRPALSLTAHRVTSPYHVQRNQGRRRRAPGSASQRASARGARGCRMSPSTPTLDRAAICASSFCDRYIERFGYDQHPDRAVTLAQARKVLTGVPPQLIPIERVVDRGRNGRQRLVQLVTFGALAMLCAALDGTQESQVERWP